MCSLPNLDHSLPQIILSTQNPLSHLRPTKSTSAVRDGSWHGACTSIINRRDFHILDHHRARYPAIIDPVFFSIRQFARSDREKDPALLAGVYMHTCMA